MSARRIAIRISSLLILLLLVALSSLALAQESSPIHVGENAIGEITASAPTSRYSLSVSASDVALVQVLALSPGFVPRFHLLNPAGVEILTVPNPDALSSLMGSVSFADAGDYLIEVSGENNTVGQFVLSLQPGVPLPPALDLALDQPVSDVVGRASPVRLYRFVTNSSDSLVLTVLAESPDAGMLISLYDEDAEKTVATSDASLSAVAYRFPAQERRYHVEIRSGGSPTDTAFSLCLGACPASLLANQPEQVTMVETPEVTAPTCTIFSATGGTVNVRSAPGTQYTIIGSMAAGQSYPVLGQLAGGQWLQVSLTNGVLGWVAASVTRLEGVCNALPTVAAPANAPLAPTQPPAPTLPPAPTTSGGGSTPPSATPTTMPTATLTPTTAPLPDLTVVNIMRVLSEDETYATIHYTVRNIGLGNSRPFTVRACDGNNCADITVTGLVSGGDFSFSEEVSHTTTFSGYSVTADYYNHIVESNEDNNSMSRTYQQ